MQGKLKDMAVADLIQHNCMDGKTARLEIHNNQQEAIVFFEAGEVIHATLDDTEGEEVIYQILSWEDGTFELQAGQKAPAKTITRGWTGLLLEGARLLDEAQNEEQIQLVETEEPKMAKTRGERLSDALAELLADSSDIDGAAIVGTDGLVYSANVPQRALDEEMVGAVSAAILGLSKRSADQLKRGGLTRSLIQGEDGNIIVSTINDETLLVGLTSKGVNLGMVFMEIRSMTETLGGLL